MVTVKVDQLLMLFSYAISLQVKELRDGGISRVNPVVVSPKYSLSNNQQLEKTSSTAAEYFLCPKLNFLPGSAGMAQKMTFCFPIIILSVYFHSSFKQFLGDFLCYDFGTVVYFAFTQHLAQDLQVGGPTKIAVS